MIPDSVVGRIVLITYNSATHLPGRLSDLEPLARSGEYSVTVVDNGSQDGTLAVLRAADWVRLIQAPENPGYAGAVNRARACGFSVVHVPDAVAMHVGAGSGDSASLRALQAVNRVRHYRKHHPRPAAWAFRLVVALPALARLRRPGQRRALGVLCGVWSAATLPGGRAGAL